MGEILKKETFSSSEDVKKLGGGNLFCQCRFEGIDFNNVEATWFHGCVFVNCNMEGLTVDNISDDIEGSDDYMRAVEYESAFLGCKGIDKIKFLRPKRTRVFVSDNISAVPEGYEEHYDIDVTSYKYSLDDRDYFVH